MNQLAVITNWKQKNKNRREFYIIIQNSMKQTSIQTIEKKTDRARLGLKSRGLGLQPFLYHFIYK